MKTLTHLLARTSTEFVTGRFPEPCWTWNGARSNGYGVVQAGRMSPGGHRMPSYVHCLVYEARVGPVAEGLELDHLCRNRACCNPDHLQPVPHAINVIRGESIAADYFVRDECGRGHPKTPENSYQRPDGKGRMCLPCQRWRSTAHYREAKASAERNTEAAL